MVPTISDLLCKVKANESGAKDALFAAAYAELRKLARSQLYRGGRNTVLDTTALVHESYLRFLNCGQLRSEDRRSFFAYAANVMRSVIIDTVRERQAQRRGGDLEKVTLDTHLNEASHDEAAIIGVHEALDALLLAEPRLVSIVEMRYFGGYTEQEIAEVLGVTVRTVRRDWEKAKILLAAMLRT